MVSLLLTAVLVINFRFRLQLSGPVSTKTTFLYVPKIQINYMFLCNLCQTKQKSEMLISPPHIFASYLCP